MGILIDLNTERLKRRHNVFVLEKWGVKAPRRQPGRVVAMILPGGKVVKDIIGEPYVKHDTNGKE